MKRTALAYRILIRTVRCLSGHKGVYGVLGKKNHFSKGVLIYEPCTIGNYNYFAPYTLANNAVIGNYCSIGPACKIGLANHDLHAVSTRANINNGFDDMNLFDYSRPGIIGNDVWLGANVVIKQGITVGNGAVIGANAVVTKDIPDYAIAVGIPAKVIGYRFDETAIESIINSHWYDYDIKHAKEKVREVSSLLLTE